MKKTIFTILFLSAVASLYPLSKELGKIKAYPNPFNPSTDVLTVQPASGAFSGTVSYVVYDYNQNEVYRGTSTGTSFQWSGYDANGLRVPPGLYFIKIVNTTAANATGTATVKVIIK